MSDNDNQIEYTTLLRALSAEKFAEIMGASSRKARETYFHRHDVRAPSGVRFVKPGAKNEARTAKLFDVLKQEADDELAEEVLRTWLLTKREMLIAALDHLSIEHDNGLTESEDLDKFEKLSAKEAKGLLTKLDGIATRDDVAIYLKFMGTPAVDKALGT